MMTDQPNTITVTLEQMAESQCLAGRARLAPHLVRLTQLREAALDDGLVWILPFDVLPGADKVEGLEVVRLPIDEPMLSYPVPR